MSNARISSYLLTAPRTRRPTLCTKLRRCYYDYSYGYREPRTFTLPDYTSTQLENRTVNAPLLRYVDSLRTHGHRASRIDPLDLLQREEVAALNPERYGLVDPSQTYDINGIIWTRPVGEDSGPEYWPLEKITRHLRDVYVGRIAYEYMHSPSKTERLWFSHLLESEEAEARKVDDEQRKRIHELLAKSEVFDQFLQLKFPNLKRYGLEGGESMLPALDALFSSSAQAGVEHIIIGMPHRGRLNLLTGMLEFPPSALFHKIKGGSELPEGYGAAAGDVISHLTGSPSLQYSGASKPVKVSLLPNPSHLEAVNPVALGKTRAKQFALLKTLQRAGETGCRPGDRVMCVQLHGDASFTGQGIVMEGLGLSNLPHYTVGGSVHLVVNIGYTTPASSARSSLYCSDVAKMINAPVLHVNGDYPEDVQRAVEVAFKYRNYFRKDIIVDLIVYRRWGHNELDEPAFTQPLMYEKIRSRRSVPALYEERLIDENVLTKDAAEAVRAGHKEFLAAELAAVPAHTPGSHSSVLQGQWAGLTSPANRAAVRDPETGVEKATLQTVGRASVAVPEGFEIHPRLQRHVKHRLQAMDSGQGLDWATAEALAFGSIMLEGCDVRISGQDVGRGTFSQRHAMLVDQKTEGVVVPLNLALDCTGRLELANSSLSEMAVLGFEYGVSWEKPDMLPIWEAQFGDFFNGAQVIIDTFISSGETKWLKQSGIVLLLPHGLDGAGPEHSSSRIERMLQLTNDPYTFHDGPDAANINMHVTFPTTPAQYFHLLRRQVKRNFRKPLIVAGPKGLLRLPAAASTLDELSTGHKFQPVLDDPAITDPESVSRVVLLSGKLYYDLAKERQKRGLDGKVAFVRVEELSPFPFRPLLDVMSGYAKAGDVVWLQEEPRNQGAWTHVEPRLNAVMERLERPRVVAFKGRREDAVPAPGIASLYAAQQKAVVEAAFEGL
ncbi:dehydrogenase E1 and transketolase domain-containing protein 1 [Lentinus tigrinus ALCF2SS1-7]|uniref:dehydrogenase E1 and transketolase domain-containing protein 1 n=1 Tax=Lentinus tigrinus ALCF2SS1-7 TaxID=1328758 RepID=UPI0011660666|nr:dehydrogenase E1 and transketolase domain-containing protein 1 [Lentinus tigrinus ALCF2SS1-7]